ncbi:translocation/assembly module TamB [Halomonas vilamensis]|uniref:Translocation/assembly module TamB n=1 Tax=Vreelandella vilamensis TaxID=531309 RepID=A0ABU1H1S1_9GAMM|nr:translocation/assembly module TamB domain-containing protein [Halomonas vilamensis]MDR5898265.1 translocation/assembly module TamB [Halomonas vilamensis]
MSQVAHTTPKRHTLSARKRVWLLLWSFIRLVVVLPLWLLSLVMLLLGWALSPWGTGVLLDQAAQREWIAFDHREGSLLETFRLEGFVLDAAGVEVSVGEFELAWAEDCVLSGELCIDTLRIAQADIRLPAGDTAPEAEQASPESSQGGAMRFPFPFSVRELALDDVTIHLGNGTTLSWAHFESAIYAAEDGVEISPTHWEKPTLYLPPSAGVRLTQNTDTPLSADGIDAAIAIQAPRAEADDEASLPIDEALAGREPITLPAIALPLDIRIPAFNVTQFTLTGATEYQVETLDMGLVTEGNRVTLTHFNATTPDARIALTANVTLHQDYPLTAELNVDVLESERLNALELEALSGQRLRLNLSGSASDLNAELRADGAVQASIDAQLNALAPTLPFTLRLQSDAISWPLAAKDDDETAHRLQALDLALEGDLNDYRLALETQASGPTIPQTHLSLTGEGDTGQFAWSPLTVGINEGEIRSHGQVEWLSPLNLSASFSFSHINPGDFVESLKGDLNGSLEIKARQEQERWALSIPALNIGGELMDYPLALSAVLDADSELNANIHQLRFAQGNNRLNASGELSKDTLSLDAEINLRELATLAPTLSGTLTGNIQARGNFSQPNLSAVLNGEALQFGENRLETLRLNADVSGVDDPSFDVTLNLANINAGGQSIERADLTLSGRLSQHRLTLDTQGAPQNSLFEQASMALEGSFNQAEQYYRAQVTPLEVVSDAGTVRLEDALDINYRIASSEANIAPFCLRREEGGVVCSEEPLTASPNAGEAVLSLREVPMQMVTPFLPDGWNLDGDTTADVTASWQDGGQRWQADMQLLSELAITAINDFGQPVELPRLALDARVNATPERAQVNSSLSFSEAGDIELSLTIADPVGEGRLNGELRMAQLLLAPYRPMVVGMDTLAGALNGNVQISGVTEEPTLQGQLELSGINAAGPDLPLVISEGEINVALNGASGTIDGFIEAERGRLAITGDAVWPRDEPWRMGVDLNATQAPLLISLPQFGRLEVAPDIRVRVTPARLQVRGNVDVPWARLEVGDIPSSATGPSRDEIIITERDDRKAQERTQAQAENGEPSAADELAQEGMAMDVLITVTLGRDMQLAAYGLESGLGGTLEVRQDSGGLQLFGDVNLVDGRFKAFGQDLLIRRGQILFSGPPGLPTLDFEAIRNPEVTEDDVIAGLSVTGLAEAPDVAIFSEPAMNETRALSYLLRGRSPDASGGGLDTALTTALIGMSLGRTGSAVGSIGEAFGIDNLTLDTTGAGEDSQVALTGQLTDDIRISYGVGIFSPIAELTLRYTLWRNLYVQAVSGASQAVDLIYEFNRPGNPRIFD